MGSISILLRRPPYGTVDAPEAIRHALGGVTEDMEVKLVLIDGGVNAARRGQETAGTEYASMESGVRDCIDMGVGVYADKASVKAERIEKDDLIDGVIVANSSEIADIIASADTTLIF